VEAVKARWLRFLLSEVVPDFSRWSATRGMERLAYSCARISRQKVESKWFKLRTSMELARMPEGALEQNASLARLQGECISAH
jgi:hypothetical protein